MKKIIFLLLLFFAHTEVLCDVNDNSQNKDSRQSVGGAQLATAPECSVGIAQIAARAALGYAAVRMAIKGAKFISEGRSSPGIRGAIKIGAGAALLSGAGIAIATQAMEPDFACFFSFARDPVFFKNPDAGDFGIQQRSGDPTSPTYSSIRWTARPAPYSDYITICARPYVPVLSLISGPNSCYSKYGGTQSYCPMVAGASSGGNINIDVDKYYSDVENNVIKEIYDGSDACLCPEEWRNMNYEPITQADGTVLASPKGDTDLSDIKLIKNSRMLSGQVDCRIGKKNDVFMLHNFKYRIVKRGAKICGSIIGLGDLPSVVGTFYVGCHYGTPGDPSPACSSSRPIRSDSMTDAAGNKIPGTGIGKIVSYDNSTCFPCFVSPSCYSTVARETKTIMPITGFLVQCIRETLDFTMFGCMNSDGTRIMGMIPMMQRRMVPTMNIIMALALCATSASTMATLKIDKSKWIKLIAMFGFVVWCMNYSLDENGGLVWIYNNYRNMSADLLDMAQGMTTTNGLCKYDASDYITTKTIMLITSDGTQTPYQMSRDNSYLKPWDELDCRGLFYFGSPLFGTLTQSTTPSSVSSQFGNGAPIQMFFRSLPIILSGFFQHPIAFITFFLSLIFLVFIMVWLIQILIFSTIISSLLFVLAPVILPLSMFDRTRSFFTAWAKELVAFMLMPMVLTTMIGFLFNLFDARIFGDTKFVPITVKVGNQVYNYFAIKDTNCDGDEICCCDPKKIGCVIGGLPVRNKDLFFGIKVSSIDDTNKYWKEMGDDMVMLLLLSFLSFFFLRLLPHMASEVSGGSRIMLATMGAAVTAEQMVGGAGSRVAGAIKNKIEERRDKAKKQKEEIGGGKEDNDKQSTNTSRK